jgi:hypothetical protein
MVARERCFIEIDAAVSHFGGAASCNVGLLDPLALGSLNDPQGLCTHPAATLHSQKC